MRRMTSKLTVVYGIPNCDTVKKARAWLSEKGVDCQFHDLKKQGVPKPQLNLWIDAVGWEKLVNRKGTAWRRLDAATQASVVDAASAVVVLMTNSSAIKRPVVEWAGGQVTVGFEERVWSDLAK